MVRMISGITNLFPRKRWYDVRAQNAVRRYCHLRNPSDIIDTIHSIKMDIPCSGILKGKYLEGVIRLVYLEELDEINAPGFHGHIGHTVGVCHGGRRTIGVDFDNPLYNLGIKQIAKQ